MIVVGQMFGRSESIIVRGCARYPVLVVVRSVVMLTPSVQSGWTKKKSRLAFTECCERHCFSDAAVKRHCFSVSSHPSVYRLLLATRSLGICPIKAAPLNLGILRGLFGLCLCRYRRQYPPWLCILVVTRCGSHRTYGPWCVVNCNL